LVDVDDWPSTVGQEGRCGQQVAGEGDHDWGQQIDAGRAREEPVKIIV
jgi:hypothetical protein